jgi:hypothetical protein
MAVLGELVEILKRWDVWKRVEAAPDRVDALEKRVTELEAKLRRAPGGPKCGELEFRTEKVEKNAGHFGQLGAVDRHLKCGACGHTEVHMDR